ncbi:hypothetical protein LOY44_07505 [Pseudomonas sp. B21-044]|uniref:hypothetical protein n=1 Tax=Pseudomonas sp. B21-044 TaxID=2895488 RepID=UPI00215F0564|nr:hypothetical protein [Pseudomonas sp. B21-044]UVL20732.1 hypothetical protein LOY44_07505 [Pseudomonas sp. B21-044]
MSIGHQSGSIRVPRAIAIHAITDASNRPAVLAGIDNQGQIFAGDQGAQGIVLDGASIFDSLGRHIDNSGRFVAADTAIRIGNTTHDGPGVPPWQKANGDLNIFNSGEIWATSPSMPPAAITLSS